MGLAVKPLILTLPLLLFAAAVSAIGVNWGTQATHSLPPATVVQLLKDNVFQKVKLFDEDSSILNALSNSGIQAMVGIPNDMLPALARSSQAAANWVATNVSSHKGVDIRYVAVGNEPFLETFNGSYTGLTLPALQNIQAALVNAGLGTRVKVTVPLNADVYQSPDNLPSNGDFRSDIKDTMLQIVEFLSNNSAPITVNIYPFISLFDDPNFPVEFAFFDSASSPINDNGREYTNVFDASYDMLVWTLNYSRRFNEAFMSRELAGTGTPMRSGAVDAFSLIDEDAKSIQPGNFERHWGLFYFDGQPKYQLNLQLASTVQKWRRVSVTRVRMLTARVLATGLLAETWMLVGTSLTRSTITTRSIISLILPASSRMCLLLQTKTRPLKPCLCACKFPMFLFDTFEDVLLILCQPASQVQAHGICKSF